MDGQRLERLIGSAAHQVMHGKRVFDQDRAKHSVEADLMHEHCALCGRLATHALAEQQCLTVKPMTTSLCCEHFTLVVDDCSYYPYDLPMQPA